MSKERILIIRLGALGDLIFCLQSFYEIRKAYPEAEIKLLTRPAYTSFVQKIPWIDGTIEETHPRYSDIRAWGALLRAIKEFAPTIVYDLQGKRRQSILYALLGGPFGSIAWSGAAPFCTFPRLWPPLPHMSFSEFLAAQLRLAGVAASDPADDRWLDAQVGAFALPSPYIVLVPGCSKDAAYKRWPPALFAQCAKILQGEGFACVCVGGEDDKDAADELEKTVPGIVNLCSKTSLFETAGIMRHARLVMGNDTGPVHLAAFIGTPTVALFSSRSSLLWSKPPGPKVEVVQSPQLSDLNVERVISAIHRLLEQTYHEG